jgi:hypothetical protein
MAGTWTYKKVMVIVEWGYFNIKMCYIPYEMMWLCRDSQYDPNHPQTKNIRSLHNFYWVVDPYLESDEHSIRQAFYISNTFYPAQPEITRLCAYLNEMFQDYNTPYIPDIINLVEQYHL